MINDPQKTKDWRPFLTKPNKLQFINAGLGSAFDTEFCITFSTLKAIQTVLNYMIASKLLTAGLIAWLAANKYLNVAGQVDLSPRFTGILSGTQKNGTSQANEIASIANNGLIPEVMLPNIGASWEDYTNPANITQAMRDLGKEFLKRVSIAIKDATLTDLSVSPLQGIVRFMDGDGILAPVGPTNHGAVFPANGDGKTYVDEDDSYWQEAKKYARNCVFFLKKFIINEITAMPTFKLQGQAAVYIAVGNVLIPICTSWETYIIDFPNNPIIELTPDQFAKFKIAKAVALKTV